MKRKDKKKAKRKLAKKLSEGREKQDKKSKKEKTKDLVKSLGKQIKRLTKALNTREDEIRALKTLRSTEETRGGHGEDLPSSFDDWAAPGSAIERKRTWERHQYLRARYEHHLAAGREKPKARALADKDLRARYGEDKGYTGDQLEAILS